MKNCWFTILMLFGILNLISNVHAQDEEASLEDLIYMGVSVATKKVERIEQAPAIISVITAEDIAETPAETLYDILEMVPGVTITESFFGYTSLSFRGIKETHYNNRTLLLLNGTPIRDVTVGTHWLESIPANVIQKIEIIRGPGSVLYGTGAFSGVISVITKSSVKTIEAGVKGGSKKSIEGEALVGSKIAIADFMIGGTYHESKGYVVDAVDETGREAQLGAYDEDRDAYENDFYNVFGNVSLDDFQLDIYHFKQEKDKFGIVPIHSMTGETTMSSTGTTLHYDRDINKLQLSSKAHYAISSYEGFLDTFAGTEIGTKYSGEKYGFDVDGIYEIMRETYFSLGFSYENQKTNPYEFYDRIQKESHWASAFLASYTTKDISGYSQIEIRLIESLKMVGGIRYNHNSEYGGTVVPRVSVVYHPVGNIFMKLLYGSAYRNPTFFEKYVNTRNVLYGDPDLDPERIDTVELSTDWMISDQTLRVTLFGLKTDDMIGRTVLYAPGEIPTVTELEDRAIDTSPTVMTPGYGNAAGQQIYGIEFEIQGDLLKGKYLGYRLNCSYKEGKEEADWSPIQFLDQVVVNLTFMNKIADITNQLAVHYIGERKGNISDSSASPDFEPGQSVVVPAYVLINWKTTYQVLESLEVSLIVRNILGQEVLYPEYVRRNIDVVPGDSGTHFFGQIKYRY